MLALSVAERGEGRGTGSNSAKPIKRSRFLLSRLQPEWFDEREGLMKPDYEGYCLSNVTPSILSLFGVEAGRPRLPSDAFGSTESSGVDNVVLFLLDGMGQREWARHKQGFIGRMNERGSVAEITSVFPSTTAAALTSLSTGLTPQEHGLPEWFVYLKEVDMIIATLPFSPMGYPGRDSLLGRVSPSVLFDGSTLHSRLRREGIPVVSFINRQIASGAYHGKSQRGNRVVPYVSSSDLSVSLRREVEEARRPTYFYVYWSMVDNIEHKYGPNSDESTVEAASFSFAMKAGFLNRLDRKTAKRTLLLVSADHGQVNVDPGRTKYLNNYRKLVASFARSAAGNPILPSGSARDVFLHVREDGLDSVYDYLADKLSRFARVLKTSEAISEGLFGINKPSKKFLERAGNILILPRGKELVWYRFKDVPPLDLRGHHGGLHPDELLIPFGSARASALLD